ncbi:MAG: hypothetical protein ACTJLM_05495 [Ehrlichia sp.]
MVKCSAYVLVRHDNIDKFLCGSKKGCKFILYGEIVYVDVDTGETSKKEAKNRVLGILQSKLRAEIGGHCTGLGEKKRSTSTSSTSNVFASFMTQLRSSSRRNSVIFDSEIGTGAGQSRPSGTMRSVTSSRNTGKGSRPLSTIF